MDVFSLHIEFDRNVFTNKIFTLIKERRKGYVCVIDGNVLAMTYRDQTYQDIVNAACINTCDGSSIATYSGAYPFTFRQPIKHKIAFKSTILYPFIP